MTTETTISLERLWPGEAPSAQGQEDADTPTLAQFRPTPADANGTAVVVCPGGGYGHLAVDHEGEQVARWLNARGVTAFLLRYRIGPRYSHPVPWLDASRAMRLVRSRCEAWNVLPSRVGIWGFSAGGHLASSVATRWDEGDLRAVDPVERESNRPDFAVLAYPVITMNEEFTHGGSRLNLLGEKPDADTVEAWSSEKQVSPRTPPTFLFHTGDDPAVPVENSLLFYAALRRVGVPAELHVYETGRHGVGLAPDDAVLSRWPDALEAWLRARGLLNARQTSPSAS